MNLLEEILNLVNEAYGDDNAKTLEDAVTQIKWAKVYIKFEDGEKILVLPPVHDDTDSRKFLHSLEDVFKVDVTYSSGTIMLVNSIAWLEKTEKTEWWERRIEPKFN